MKNLLFIVLALIVFACESSDDLASPGSASAINVRSAQERPFSADLTGVIDLDFPSPPTVCTGDVPLALVDYELSGEATHLGNLNADYSTLHHDDCNVSIAAMELTLGVSGQIMAANGDVIYYSGDDVIDITNFVIPSNDPTGLITGTWTITGGTGRFEGATGSFTIEGIVDFTTLSFTAVADGTITF